MRDYAELGKEAARQGRRSERERSRVDVLWSAAGSPAATIALELLLCVLLVLEAAGEGNPLPEANPARLGPMAIRLVLALLCVQLVVSFLGRLLPTLLPRRAGADDLGVESALSTRRRLPELPEDPELAAELERAGARPARPAGKRRAFGVSGRLAALGVPLVHIGAVTLLFSFIGHISAPATGLLRVEPGEETETVEITGYEGAPLAEFTGMTFELSMSDAATERLARGDAPTEDDPVTLTVRDLSRGVERDLSVVPHRNLTLTDGSQIRLSSVRQIPDPGAARLRAGGSTQRVSLGDTLSIDGEVFRLARLSEDHQGLMGPAAQLEDAEGRAFWLFAERPHLTADISPEAPRATLEALLPRYSLTFERFQRTTPRAPLLAGVALLLFGASLLLSSNHLAVEVVDEVDRLVLRGVSVNAAAAVPESLETLAHATTEAMSAETPEAPPPADATVAEDGAEPEDDDDEEVPA